MANRYGGITGSKKISEDWNNINLAFDKVQADVDAKAATVNSHIANADIHVTKADKTKWDGHVANADIHVTAAQKAAWDAKADGSTSTELAAHIADQEVHVTQADHDKLGSIETGAQVNQNAFAKVNDIEAADPSSQFYIVGGIGITVTTNPNTGEITVTATGSAAPGAHGITHTEHGADPIPTATLTEGGLLSAAQLAEIITHGELLDEHAAAITDLEDRLDAAEVVPVTLQPGLQVVTAAKDARFKLGEIRGRTLINLLGNRGNCDSTNPSYYLGRATLSVDTAVKHSGSASLQVLSNTAAGSHYFRFMNTLENLIPVTPGEKVLLGAWVKPLINSGASVTLIFFDASFTSNIGGANSEPTFDTTRFSPVTVSATVPAGAAWLMVQVSITDSNGQLDFTGTGAEGLNLDSAYLYKISDAEYAALDGMTNDQIADKYPLVPSGIIGSENPYAIATSDNLLPPFYDGWVTRISYSGIKEPYSTSLPAATAQVLFADINVIPELEYTLSIDILRCRYVVIHDNNASVPTYLIKESRNPDDGAPYSVSFTATQTGVVRVHFYAYDVQAEIDGADRNTLDAYTIHVVRPMLSVGAAPKPFEPQRKSVLAFQTEIHANPVDGSDQDVLFEQDGEYRKLAKWKKVIVDGSLPWRLIHAAGTGYKNPIASISGLPKIKGTNQGCVTNYRGSILSPSTPNAEGGFYIDSSNIVLSIPNTDSGWGDTYSPTADEIKAYFNGWKMYQEGNRDTPYTSGKKQWFKINKINESSVDVLPTSSYAEWTPYQLLYRLALEAVESITLEGSLTLTEGNNMVEVGTGIVLRESVKPKQHANTNWIINNMGVGTSLSNKVSAIKAIYRDSRRDYKWVKEAVIGAWGIEQAYISNANYDQSAAYSVTYLKLDKSPIAPITGSLAANEKAQLSDLTAGVAEALQRVSVVEQKKAEKDAPGWIKPVLLNGWLDYSGVYPAAFFKDSSGIVHIRGLIKSGATVSDTIIFTLPPGYRPKTANMQIPQVTLDSSTSTESVGRIMIDTLGHVRVGKASTGFLTLHASFLAEQ
ncbi:hypothetical protein QNH46_07935 [Paenibacillus woosongensis]|uniref:Uncharacterized protein n=1 Tax=Paenibacillus woosongensis TaxID=307580 RepID=A0AA95I6D0_9BACL|nr:hypothetical protein [Paenibacillus woosongensis]WHX50565.1 hypothetical protein QNH46_07935 [Paenibacillus woosongensis]